MASSGQRIDCHKIVVSTLSPYVMNLLARGHPDSDQVILPDYGLGEICGLVNFVYTGRLVD